MLDGYNLKIIMIRENSFRSFGRYSFDEIEEYIKSQTGLKKDKGKSLIETVEYQSIRNHIEEFQKYSDANTCLKCDYQCTQRNILISFQKYNVETLLVPDHDSIKCCFQACNFNTLDYSQSNQQELNDQSLCDNEIKSLILFQQQQVFESKSNTILSLSFMSYDIVKLIIENNFTKNFFVENKHINEEFLDFSQFHKLKVLHLGNINQNIRLPDSIQYLSLSSNSQSHQVLNKTIQADDISFSNLTLTGKKYLANSKVHLISCCIDYMQIEDLYYLINSKDTQTLIINEYEHIDEKGDINKIILLSKNIKSISVHNSTQILLLQPIKQNFSEYNKKLTRQQFYQQKQPQLDNLDLADTLDLSYLTNLQKYNNRHQTNKIIFPTQIRNISLSLQTNKIDRQCFQKEQQQRFVFDFSNLKQLQTLNINIFKMEKLFMFDGQLQFEFQRSLEAFILMQRRPSNIESSCQDFIQNVTKIQIFGLENITIEGKVKEAHDFSQFLSLQELFLQGINKRVLLPIKLQQLYIEYCSAQDLDLINYKDLNSLTIYSCQINNIITTKSIILNDSTVNNFQGEYIYEYSCRQYINSITQINFYEPDNIRNDIFIDKIHIKTLKLHTINNIHKIHLCGINTIITSNTFTNGIIDFTHFQSLHTVFLKQITCTKIKFGSQQSKVTIDTAINQLKHLDFSLCCSKNFNFKDGEFDVVSSDFNVKNCKIDVLSVESTRIKFTDCVIRIVNLCQCEKNVNLRKFCQAFTGQAKWIMKHKEKSKQRILVELYADNVDRKGFFRSFKTLGVGFILGCKIDFIWGKIHKILYE